MYTADDFNTFVMNVNTLIYEIRERHLENGKYKIDEFDLRTPYGDIFCIPAEDTDYISMWNAVKDAHKEFFNGGASEFFFDVYWNDTSANIAHFDDAVLWVFFYGESITYQIN